MGVAVAWLVPVAAGSAAVLAVVVPRPPREHALDAHDDHPPHRRTQAGVEAQSLPGAAAASAGKCGASTAA